MEEIAPQIDIETEINDRRKRHICLMKDLDGVMEVLLSFCEQAKWMMNHDYRIGELIGEVVVASTEVEHILPRSKKYSEEIQHMILPAIDRQKPKDFDKAMQETNNIIPLLKPYCEKVRKDELELKEFRKGEAEVTSQLNDQYISYYEIVIENFTAAIAKLERNIVVSNKIHLSLSSETIKINYKTLYLRYYNEHKEDLEEYITDIDDIGTAKKELLATYQATDLLPYYNQYEKHPDQLVIALRENNKNEKSLLTIFCFKSRLDAIKNKKTAAKNKEKVADDKEQPENIVFRKFHDGKQIDFLTISKTIELRLVDVIKFKYEWYAAYRILSDLNILEDIKLSSFAKQMNIWFPNARIKCKDDAFGDYATGHTGKKFELWNEEVFIKEKKKNQSITGFRKIYNICNELKFHLNPIPTLAPRQQ